MLSSRSLLLIYFKFKIEATRMLIRILYEVTSSEEGTVNYGQPFLMTVAVVSLGLLCPSRGAASWGSSDLTPATSLLRAAGLLA